MCSMTTCCRFSLYPVRLPQFPGQHGLNEFAQTGIAGPGSAAGSGCGLFSIIYAISGSISLSIDPDSCPHFTLPRPVWSLKSLSFHSFVFSTTAFHDAPRNLRNTKPAVRNSIIYVGQEHANSHIDRARDRASFQIMSCAITR